ncbi:MAG: DUF4911 domain-containing protein [Deltaproteobacteria bacterium]|nr:DUF4911 domain-containing protein [Deltaproteobacteria bacterium]
MSSDRPRPSSSPGRRRRGRLWPAPPESARLYCGLHPSKVHIFRYFLEAEDHLGLMTVTDRRKAIVQLRFSPHQREEVLRFLDDLRTVLPFSILAEGRTPE